MYRLLSFQQKAAPARPRSLFHYIFIVKYLCIIFASYRLPDITFFDKFHKI